MNTHLDENEISAAVAGIELEPPSEKHLHSCLSCRQQVSQMRGVIDEERRKLKAEAPDWDRQRQEILMRLPLEATGRPVRRRVWTRPLLTVAAVFVAAIGLRALWAPAPAIDPTVSAELPVEQILADVDAVLADDSIPGFEFIDPGMSEMLTENGES